MDRHLHFTGTRPARSLGLGVVATVLAASVGVAAGCSAEGQLSSATFSDRLETIRQEGSQHWGRVAQQAADLQPGDLIQGDLEQAIRELDAFQLRAADELRGLETPEAAEEEIAMLIEALLERSVAFQQALEARRFSTELFDRIGQAGERIDLALGRLRAKGFLASGGDDEH